MKTFAAISALIVLAACSTGPDADDVAFLQGMIPHHEQAIEMARLAPQAAQSREVRDLAGRIESAQGPEITEMTEKLAQYGEPAESEHGDHAMAGMANDADIAKLQKAKGDEFDDLFLSLMIAHHEGAIEMAEEVKDKGSDGDVKKLADEIIEAQQAEIDEMKGLLK